MPLILSGNELYDTNEISNIAHKHQDSSKDFVIKSTELTRINRIDKAIYESQQEILDGAETVEAIKVFDDLERKYFGWFISKK